MKLLLVLLGVIATAHAATQGEQYECGELDLVFLADRSGSIGNEWPTIVKFIDDLIALLCAGNINTRVGIVSFATDVTTDLPLTPCGDAAIGAAVADLNSRTSGSGTTHTDKALPVAAALFTDPTKDRVIVTLTDGEPCCEPNHDQLTRDAINLLDNTIVRHAIEIGDFLGNAILDDLVALNALTPGDRHKVDNPAGLHDMLKVLASALCGNPLPVQCDPWVYFNAHSYKLCRTPVNYQNARECCEEFGGYVVEINDVAENNFVSGLILKQCKHKKTWLGGNKDNHWTDVFEWQTTGDQFWPCPLAQPSDACLYEKWGPGLPDNTDWAKCLQLDLNWPNNGRWDDLNCKRWRPFVCERDCCSPPESETTPEPEPEPVIG